MNATECFNILGLLKSYGIKTGSIVSPEWVRVTLQGMQEFGYNVEGERQYVYIKKEDRI